MSQFLKSGETGRTMKYEYAVDSKTHSVLTTSKPLVQHDLGIKDAKSCNIKVVNRGNSVLFARVILEGIPITGDQTSAENDLRMKIEYKDMEGNHMNPVKIEQGTDFIANVTVTNPGYRGYYKEMALTQIFPSGWEIHNTRLDEHQNVNITFLPKYQDIRDDRVYTYFDLKPGETKMFTILLNASYLGRFYLPTVSCEAMYDNTINSRQHGQWIKVVEPGNSLTMN